MFAIGLLGACVTVQLVLFGADSHILAAIAAVGEIIVYFLISLALAGENFDRLWRCAWPALACFALAMAWGAAPLLLSRYNWPHGELLDPDGVCLELVKLAGLAALGLASAKVARSRPRLHQLAHWLVAYGLAFILLSLWLEQSGPLAIWGQSKLAHAFRFTGPLLNANVAGCVFGMFGLVSLGLLQHLLRRLDLRSTGLFGYLVLTLVTSAALASYGACVLTQSRTALFFSVALGLVVIVSRLGGRPQRNYLVAVAAGLLLLIGVGLGVTQVSSRWDTVLIDASVRAEAFGRYLAALKSSPWLGFGLGAFKQVHEASLTPRLAPQIWDFGAAHSAALQAALEGGWPFLALMLGALAWILKGIVLPAADRRQRGSIVAGLLAAAALAAISAMGDIALNFPAVAAFATLLLGAAWGDAIGGSARPDKALRPEAGSVVGGARA